MWLILMPSLQQISGGVEDRINIDFHVNFAPRIEILRFENMLTLLLLPRATIPWSSKVWQIQWLLSKTVLRTVDLQNIVIDESHRPPRQ